MAKKAESKKKITLLSGENFSKITSFGNYQGLGELNFQKMERGEVVTVDELTDELNLLIKDKKITLK
tara:strand:+ start:1753 stop:1953 length:201 start_codon:yes stop_codon:yes gene_type:complete